MADSRLATWVATFVLFTALLGRCGTSQICLPEIFTRNAERYGLIGIAFGIVTWLFGYAAVVIAAAVVAGTWDRRRQPLGGVAPDVTLHARPTVLLSEVKR